MDGLNELTATIRQVTADRATLDLSGQIVSWPAAALPAGAKEGDTVRLRMLTEHQAESDRHELARAILSEILGSRS